MTVIFYFEKDNRWYAVQNNCPHKEENVLSRGLTGDTNGEAKIVCPLHKHAFSLENGKHLGGDESMALKTYPVEIRDDKVFVEV